MPVAGRDCSDRPDGAESIYPHSGSHRSNTITPATLYNEAVMKPMVISHRHQRSLPSDRFLDEQYLAKLEQMENATAYYQPWPVYESQKVEVQEPVLGKELPNSISVTNISGYEQTNEGAGSHLQRSASFLQTMVLEDKQSEMNKEQVQLCNEENYYVGARIPRSHAYYQLEKPKGEENKPSNNGNNNFVFTNLDE
ncbi:hypothetical protein Ciccas_002053 [Cichlidogyrus casuarinus]|uniref:Uncharacterized protein n=1 Tax=Cichlidogyrus casuarinus TaxID=1844966 RepID=A0ABD2QKL0_9PLAT